MDVDLDSSLLSFSRERFYDSTLERLNRKDEEDEDEEDEDEDEEDTVPDEDDTDSDDVEDEKPKVGPADLAEFLAAADLGAERGFDLGTLESAMAALPDLRKTKNPDLREWLDRAIESIRAIVACLANLNNRYAILWARARLAEMLGEQEEKDYPEFYFKIGGESHRMTLPMEVDADEKKELDELFAIINQRTTNVARADDVFVKARKRESPFDRFLLVQGAENMDIEITSVKPFVKKRLADPRYLATIVTAVNAVTAPWRLRTSRTVEDIEAQNEKKLARIERKFPQYWGPEGVGAMICALGALIRYLEALVSQDKDGLPGRANDPHACFAVGFPALKALSARLDEIRGEEDPRHALEDVKPVRQFFLTAYFRNLEHVPDEKKPLAELVHQVITQEVELDRSRRSAHTSSTSQKTTNLLRLAYVANREFVAENELGRAVILGNCELVRLEPGKKVTNEKRLLKLLNAAFDTASHSRVAATMFAF